MRLTNVTLFASALTLTFSEFSAAMATATTTKRQKYRLENRI